MSKRGVLLAVALTASGFAGGAYWLLSPSSDGHKDIPFRFHVDGNTLLGHDLTMNDHLGSILVTAGVSALNLDRWTELTPDRMRGVCGGLLIHLKAVEGAGLDRDDVYRVAFTTNPDGMTPRRDKSRDSVFPVNVHKGACVAPPNMREFPLGLPGAGAGWAMVGVVPQDGDTIAVTFDPLTGVSYSDAIAVFDPIFACHAALSEAHKTDVTPLDRDQFSQMHVIARNRRGNSLLNFSTYRSWDLKVAGAVCTQTEGAEG